MPAASGTATLLHSLASKAPSFTPAQPHALILVCAFTPALPRPLLLWLHIVMGSAPEQLLAIAVQF